MVELKAVGYRVKQWCGMTLSEARVLGKRLVRRGAIIGFGGAAVAIAFAVIVSRSLYSSHPLHMVGMCVAVFGAPLSAFVGALAMVRGEQILRAVRKQEREG